MVQPRTRATSGKENHLRWDSLGEFMLGASFEHLANATNNPKAKVLGTTIDIATERYLMKNAQPQGRRTRQPWHPRAVAAPGPSLGRANRRCRAGGPLRLARGNHERRTGQRDPSLNEAQGNAVDLGGYFRPDATKADAVMRPVAMFNDLPGSRWRLNSG